MKTENERYRENKRDHKMGSNNFWILIEVINLTVLYHSTKVTCLRAFLYLTRLKLVQCDHLKRFLDSLGKFNFYWQQKFLKKDNSSYDFLSF